MELKQFLDRKVAEFNQPSFIPDDPISIPHRFRRKQDIEIAGFFAAIFSWGNRPMIVRKSRELMDAMDNAPYAFIMEHEEKDLRRLKEFRHRTFNLTDLLYFIAFFRHHYSRFDSLEDAFLNHGAAVPAMDAFSSLSGFHRYFFSLEDIPARTSKHVATPDRRSACKRLNMYLRWMVRKDDKGVDFGLWKRISPASLIVPLDLHVGRVAGKLGLLTRKQADWQAAMELTEQLRILDPEDPVKYDFALFGLGIFDKF